MFEIYIRSDIFVQGLHMSTELREKHVALLLRSLFRVLKKLSYLQIKIP